MTFTIRRRRSVADKPSGPYKDLRWKPLIGEDGQYYLISGGWSHCNIAKLKDNFVGFVPSDDGTVHKEITSEGYIGSPIIFRPDGRSY